MSVEFTYFLICFLLPRLFTQWNDEPGTQKPRIFIIAGIEVIMLLPLVSRESFLVIAVLFTGYHVLLLIIEKKSTRVFLNRIIEFLFLLITASFLFGIFLNDISFNSASLKIFSSILNGNALTKNLSVESISKTIKYAFAILVVINEINNVIRFVLELVKVEPQQADDTRKKIDADSNCDHDRSDLNKEELQVGDTRTKSVADPVSERDNKELGRGKIIGAIERTLFFFFVITGNYSSIAFILAAKGFTRFKELDEKNFAEYVLIGTLLSSALSIFWAYIIMHAI